MSLFEWFPGRAAEVRPALVPKAEIPEGSRLYVFGDVHGRLDLLERLADAVARDWQRSPGGRLVTIGLGDYIDRGPNSCGVVDRLVLGLTGGDGIYIRGNHEQILLDFLEDPVRHGVEWFRNGGSETLKSYGIRGPSMLGDRADMRRVRDELARVIPVAHLLFMQRLSFSYSFGDYFFVHAGARPKKPLDRQSNTDLMWIKRGFADRDEGFEKVIVHGHTPVSDPFIGQFRINIDTGAYTTGRLTCLILEGSTRRLIVA